VPGACCGTAVAFGVIWLTDRTRFAAAHRLAAGPALRRHRVWALSSAQLPFLRNRFGVSRERLCHPLFGIEASYFSPAMSSVEPGQVVSVGNDQGHEHDALLRGPAAAMRRSDGFVVSSRNTSA
jgi:hypothetical protein